MEDEEGKHFFLLSAEFFLLRCKKKEVKRKKWQLLAESASNKLGEWTSTIQSIYRYSMVDGSEAIQLYTRIEQADA